MCVLCDFDTAYAFIVEIFPGWGRFIAKIGGWIHNYPTWSPKGGSSYAKFVTFSGLSRDLHALKKSIIVMT